MIRTQGYALAERREYAVSGRGQGRKAAERQHPEAFFNAAIKILGEEGPERLTVNRLCARLGVTKGSFYHHFADFDAFVVAFMAAWNGMFTQYMEQLETEDLVRALEINMGAIASLPHEAEGALRAWARTNATVAAAVRLQDETRERKSQEWLVHFIDDPERRRVLAHMGVCLLTGMQQRLPPDRELILAACIELAQMFLGVQITTHATPDGPRFEVSLPGAPA